MSCSPTSSPICRAIFNVAGCLRNGFRIRLDNGASSFWFDSRTREGPLCSLVDFVHISDAYMRVSDCWDQGHWKFNSLSIIFSEHLRNLVEISIPLVSTAIDCWVWSRVVNGKHSTSSTYQWLLSCDLSPSLGHSWRWILRLKAPLRFAL